MKTFFRTLGGLFILVLAGCQFPSQLREGVVVQIQSPSRSIVPDWANEADEYTINLTSTELSLNYSKVVQTLGAVEFSAVPAGIWQVDVVATKALTIVAAGSLSGFQVSSTGVSSATVALVGDKTGQGGYRFELILPNEAGVTSVEAQLFDDLDSPVGGALNPAPAVGASETSFVFEQNSIAGGDYRLALTVKRGSVTVGQFSESVNIWTGIIAGLWMAPDGTLSTVRRLGLDEVATANAHLSNLVVGGGSSLEPSFSSLTTVYTIVSDDGKEMTLTPAESVAGQSIAVQIGTGPWTPLPSGQESDVMTAAPGLTVTLRVTAPDGTSTQDYVIGIRIAAITYVAANDTAGTPPVDTYDYQAGDTITILGNTGNLVRQGYQFAGWNTKADGTGTTVIAGTTLTYTGSPFRLYPVWLPDGFTFINSLSDPLNGSYLKLKSSVPDADGLVTVPNGVTSLGSFALNGSEITGVVLPPTVVALDANSFFTCENLVDFDIPGSVRRLGRNTFYVTGFTSLHIPATVLEILGPPVGSSTLASPFLAYDVASTNPNYSSTDGVLYNKTGTILIGMPGGRTGSFTVPELVTGLGLFAFSWSHVTEVVLPDSLTEVDFFQFQGANSLAAFQVNGSHPTYSVISGMLYNKAGTELKLTPSALVGTLTIPDGTTKIGNYAASGMSGITSIEFPASVTVIGLNGISNNTALVSLTVPSTILQIENNAFDNSYGLTSVTFEGAPTLGYRLFSSCETLNLVTMESNTPPDLPEFSEMFRGCAPDLVIQVPAAAVDAYKNAQGWSEYADRIVAQP